MSFGFSALANHVAHAAGRPVTFFFALVVVVAWALLGPVFAYSETWQLIINTGTTIVTFLLLFLVQNTQMRDTAAMHLKLDEIIRALTDCEDGLLNAETLTQEELDARLLEYQRMAEIAREKAQAA